MLRALVVFSLALATAGPAAAQSTVPQPRPKCPVARVTLLGAAVGFGAGALIGFHLNVFEDTVNGEGKAWMTTIGLAAAGAVIGNVFAQRECAASSPSSSPSGNVVLTESELLRLSRTIRLRPVREDQAVFAPRGATEWPSMVAGAAQATRRSRSRAPWLPEKTVQIPPRNPNEKGGPEVRAALPKFGCGGVQPTLSRAVDRGCVTPSSGRRQGLDRDG